MDWSLADVEAAAKERLSQLAYDYAAGGAGDEAALRESVAAFARWRFRPRFLVDVSARDLSVEMLGRRHPAPFAIAPTAFHRLFHEGGERAVARAAKARGVLHCVSTLSTTPLEDVAQEGAPRWFQVYVHKDRALTKELVLRAKAAGYEALVLTVDAPVWGQRERDRRNRFSLPPPLTLANFEKHLPAAGGGQDGLARYVNSQLDPALTWRDLDWLQDISGLPVLVKGIMTAEDARVAMEHRAAGVIVSNHGGRQLDRHPATLDVLPEVVAAVDGRAPVLMDGGIRRGADVLVALAMGADMVLLGRPIVWGLAAGGEEGVGRVLDAFRNELDNAMALTGLARAGEASSALVQRA